MAIRRELFSEVMGWTGQNKVIVIKGARQVGKTTLLLDVKAVLEAEGRHTLYLSADEHLGEAYLSDPRLFLQYVQYECGVSHPVAVFLDEFQYIAQAGLFVKVLIDTIKREGLDIQVFVSGSSSLALSKNTEFLTGRKIEFQLSPFTFREVLAIHELPVPRFKLADDFGALSDYYQIYRHALWSHFASYLTWGGYPEVVLAESPESKRILLKEILATYIQKDVSGFLKIENTSAFNKLVRLLSTQIGSLVNRHELSATLGIDQRTVSKYLDVLEGTYVCSLVKPFFSNARKELSKMPKVYVCDAGIYHFYHAQGFNTYETLSGHLVENYVYLGLRHNRRADSIQFYRTISKSEVDFIVTQEDVLIPIEVKFQASPKMPVSVTRFMENYSAPKAVVITQDRLACSGAHMFLPAPLLEMVTL